MKRLNKIKLLILTLTVAFGGVSSYADTEVNQTILMSAQPAVSIEKDTASSRESGTINVQTGVHEGLHTVFTLQTNETDDAYDFIITSHIMTDGGQVSAYGNNGSILFGHSTNFPTASAIADAKAGGNTNRNVIAYPVRINTTSPLTSSFDLGNGKYGDCYVIKVNNGTSGSVTHFVLNSPVQGTYSVSQDESGSYQSVIVFSAVSK